MSNKKTEFKQCICSGKSLDRMLRPAVLTILHTQPQGLHGYAIEKQLQSLRFFKSHPPDYTGLYRLLKQMEDEGLLTSKESDSLSGPSRRIYRLSEKGINCLSRWVESLETYQEMLCDLLSHMNEAMGIDI